MCMYVFIYVHIYTCEDCICYPTANIKWESYIQSLIIKRGGFGNSWQGCPDFSGITIKPVLVVFGTAP